MLPTLGTRKTKEISRSDLWRLFDDLQDRPALANAVLASASAVFSWTLQRDLIASESVLGYPTQ